MLPASYAERAVRGRHAGRRWPRRRARLVVAQPDAAVGHAEGEHMVTEGLALVVPPRRGKRLRQHLLEQLQVRLLVERLRAAAHALSVLECVGVSIPYPDPAWHGRSRSTPTDTASQHTAAGSRYPRTQRTLLAARRASEAGEADGAARLVEAEDGAGALQVVAAQLQLGHRVHCAPARLVKAGHAAHAQRWTGPEPLRHAARYATSTGVVTRAHDTCTVSAPYPAGEQGQSALVATHLLHRSKPR